VRVIIIWGTSGARTTADLPQPYTAWHYILLSLRSSSTYNNLLYRQHVVE
jgi:hypothetical protein